MQKKIKNHKEIHILAIILVFTVLFGAVTPASAKVATGKQSLMSMIKLAFADDESVAAGGDNPEPVFPDPGEREPRKKIKVVITAYSSTPDETDSTPCITANGHDLCRYYETNGYGNTVAANFLPFGTTVRLPGAFGGKEFVVRDRMNARYGYGRIDVWMPSKAEAKKFGVKRIEMEVF